MSTTRRRWAFRLGALVGATALGFLVAEVVVRQRAPEAGAEFLYDAPSAMPKAMYQDDPELLQVAAPGFDETVATFNYRVRVRFNSLGLRGDPKLKGRTWLALGDSITMAVQVDEDATFSAELSKKLGFSVLNAGVDGYSTWQATGRYQRLDPVVNAEGALLTYFLGNDLAENHLFPYKLNERRRGGLPPPPEVRANPLERLLMQHSALYTYWRIAEKSARIATGTDPAGQRFRNELMIFTAGGRQELQNLTAKSRDALTDFKRAVEARGDRLMVALAPPSFAIDPAVAAATLAQFGLHDPAPDAPRQAILGVLQQLAMPTCDLSPPLQEAAAAGGAPFFKYDGHFTAEGHRVVAAALADCLGS